MSRRFRLAASRLLSKLAPAILVMAGISGVFFVNSCGTVNHALVVPPEIPGASYIGAAECSTCHEDITKWFPTATHARLMAAGTNAIQAGCEGCHGPGSLHSEAGGGARNIVNPGRSPEVCFRCHLDKRGEFNLPYHHPVLEGKVSCSDCHDPHKGDAIIGGGTALLTEREVCGKCHTAQLGPFVFEHEATREGCSSCHRIHGSVNAKLLQERSANLCLKCHFQQQTSPGAIRIGTRDHTAFLRRGTCWSAGCHEAAHGSQVSEHLRY